MLSDSCEGGEGHLAPRTRDGYKDGYLYGFISLGLSVSELEANWTHR